VLKNKTECGLGPKNGRLLLDNLGITLDKATNKNSAQIKTVRKHKSIHKLQTKNSKEKLVNPIVRQWHCNKFLLLKMIIFGKTKQ
jgi:hypothetical protein